MDRTRKRKIAAGAAALTALAGGGGAIAATHAGSPGEESKAIVDDAAKRLGVSPGALSDALKQAMDARVDAAVAAGSLTKEQGDALKKQIDAQDYPALGFGRHGFGPLGPRLPGRLPGFGILGAGLDAAAGYLDLTTAELRTQLSSGKTMAQIATDRGKTVSGLVDALVAAAKTQLADAVKAGRLTQTQSDAIAGGLEQRVTNLVNGAHLRLRGGPGPMQGPLPFRGHGPHRGGGGGPGMAA